LAATAAWADPPQISYLSPAAVQPGAATAVVVRGANLTGPSGAWTNFPATVQLASGVEGNGQNANQATYEFTVGADVPMGIYGFRIATGTGISPLKLLMIDSLPTVAENGTNKTPESAQEIPVPTAVEGACEAESYDFFRFNGTAGQRLAVEVVAMRLGSALDPVIRLIDSAGRELAYSDDEPGLYSDCRFSVVLPASGPYLLEVRDVRYQGGEGHRYRIRMGEFPLVSVPYPLGGAVDSTVRLTPIGPDVSAGPLDVKLAASEAPQTFANFRLPGRSEAGIVRVAVSSAVENIEFEPNDTSETACLVSIPGVLNGRLPAARDRDWYAVDGKQGQRFVWRGKTRSLGSPTDLYLRLFAPDGNLAAESDDAGTEEGVIDYAFPADGTYRLMVEELNRGGGPEHAYRIEVSPYQPGFALALEAEKFDPPQGGTFVAKVTSARRDYNGPITLSLEGAPEGTAVEGNLIAEGQNETVLRATLPGSVPAGALAIVRIVGRAKIGETEFSSIASTLAPLRAAQNGLPYPPEDLIGTIGLGVGPVFPDFFKLSLEPAEIPFPQLVGTTSFKITLEKLNGFDDQVSLALSGLPAGFSADVKPIPKGQAEAVVVVTGPATVAEQVWRISLSGSGVFQNQSKSQTVADVPFVAVRPLGVRLELAGPIAPAGKQALKVVLTRYGEEKPPVEIELRGLPEGVTAPGGLFVPDGASELLVELSAEAGVTPKTVSGVTAWIRGTVKGRQVTSESPPVALEIKGS
jgi:hypothetical protein